MASASVVAETPLEIASGLVSGSGPYVPGGSQARAPRGAALIALEAAVLPALLRGPCLVSFSGGTDSSLVLAVATHLARRHRLPEPVPVTWRFPGLPETDESEAQARVVAELGLQDWVVLVPEADELDFVGPAAERVLRRHGVRHPANLHFHAKPVALAHGGSLLTGAGGDQVLSGWRRPDHHTLARRLKDRVPALARARVKQAVRPELPWLRPAPAGAALAGRLQEETAEPVWLADRARWHLGRRDLQLTLANLRLLGEPEDVAVVSPLADARFVHALAGELGDRPAPRRDELVRALTHGALPGVVAERRRKARFGRVFLGDRSRALAHGWDGGGVDPAVVDVDRLRACWSAWPVPLATAGLLQQVFLSQLPAGPRAAP